MTLYVSLDRALYLGRTVGLPASRQLAEQLDYLRVVGSIVKAPLDGTAVGLKRIRTELEALGGCSVPQLSAMKALAKATTVAEVKSLRDKAEAMRAYTRNVNAGLEAQIRCEAGQMLIDMAERGERRGDGNN